MTRAGGGLCERHSQGVALVAQVVARPEIDKISADGRSLKAAEKVARLVALVDDGRHEASVYEHAKLPPGVELKGPPIVEEATFTTLVHPGQIFWVGDFGFLHIADT